MKVLLIIFTTVLLIFASLLVSSSNYNFRNENEAFENAINVLLICENRSDLIFLLGSPFKIEKSEQLENFAKEASWYSLFTDRLKMNSEADLDVLIYLDADYVYGYSVNKEDKIVNLSLWHN